MERTILILTGPTGSGKSNLAMLLAEKIPAVIINADSMQVYREIPVITAQPTAEEQARVPHLLYGVLPVAERCTVVEWTRRALAAIGETWKEGRMPVLVGGTGLYLRHLMLGTPPTPKSGDTARKEARRLLEEMGNEAFHRLLAEHDPTAAARLDVGNSQRLLRAYEVFLETGIPMSEWQKKPYVPFFPPGIFRAAALAPEREEVYGKVNRRFASMVHEGALEEAEAVRQQRLDPSLPALKAHGLPELIAHLEGKMTIEEAIAQAQMNTRNYIKRQFTWLRTQMPQVPRFEKPEEALVQLLKK